MSNHFSNTQIVLINTTHPGNIGSTARAMATMGFNNLTLINPRKFPNKKADELAVSAKPILDNAKVCDDFKQSVSECSFVLGLSARWRDHMPPVVSLRQAAVEWAKYAKLGKTAFVFGTESSGLENEVLYQCHRLVTIPVSKEFSSLNLASAVQLMCYEARISALGDSVADDFSHDIEHPTSEDINHLVEHFEVIMAKTDYLPSPRRLKIIERLRIMFYRAAFERQDVRVLRGFLKQVEKNITS